MLNINTSSESSPPATKPDVEADILNGEASGAAAADTVSASKCADIDAEANRRADVISRHLFPGGRRQGWGWLVNSVSASCKKLKVTIIGKKSGQWEGEGFGAGKGQNMIEVWHHAKCVSVDEAKEGIAAFLSQHPLPVRVSKSASKRSFTASTRLPGATSKEHEMQSRNDSSANVKTSSSNAITKNDSGALSDSQATTAPVGDSVEPPSASIQMPLTGDEKADYDKKLGRLKQIEGSWFEGCQLLLEIRDQRLYREHYPTFEAFCRKELDMGKSNCNRMVRTGEVAQRLATTAAKKPEHEAHVRPLLRLSDPDQQVEAYQRAEDLAKEAGKALSAVHVTRAVRELKSAEQSPEAGKASGPGKGELITQISRSLRDELEKLTPDQLSAFDKAFQEFKAEWLRNLPSEAPAAENAESTETVHAS